MKDKINFVNFVVPTFFDMDGNNMFFGGAERYLIELVRLVHDLGYETNIYQCANSDWVRYYLDVRVTGLPAHNSEELNKVFHLNFEPGILTIYFAFFLASPYFHQPSIGISHGIYWDEKIFQHFPYGLRAQRELLAAISHLSTFVSVDTNTINWLRAVYLELAARSIYIPNFVDFSQFNDIVRKKETENSKIVVLYPRRLYPPRGFWLMRRLIPEFLEKYTQVEFHFVGKADIREQQAVEELVNRFPGRVRWYFLSPERMHEAYQSADIVVIPTIESEGTSLSCLEALASGNAVIATNVGGLPNLVIPGYNGLLIEPTEESLREALSLLLDNPGLRYTLSARGVEVAREFNIEKWREQWKRVFKVYLHERPSMLADPITAVFYPPRGSAWNGGLDLRFRHLAEQIAELGVEVFWVDPNGRGDSGNKRIHLVSERDDLYLLRPWVVLAEKQALVWLAKYEAPLVIYDVVDDTTLADILDVTDAVNFFITPSNELASRALVSEKKIALVSSGTDLMNMILKEQENRRIA